MQPVIVERSIAACVVLAALVFEVRRLRAFGRDVDERWRQAFMSL